MSRQHMADERLLSQRRIHDFIYLIVGEEYDFCRKITGGVEIHLVDKVDEHPYGTRQSAVILLRLLNGSIETALLLENSPLAFQKGEKTLNLFLLFGIEAKKLRLR